MFRCTIIIVTISYGIGLIFHAPAMRMPSKLYGQKIVAPIFESSHELTGITLSRYMVETSVANPDLRELESLISAIQIACKTIANVVERASITGVTGLEAGGGSINIQGEEQKRLDVITNDIMKSCLRYSGKVGVLASEEEDVPVTVDKKLVDKYRDQGLITTQFKGDVIIEDTGGKYVAVFDPLDGSSNVDAGIPTGFFLLFMLLFFLLSLVSILIQWKQCLNEQCCNWL
jgi:fructose-1,6-bisphosphatase I